MVASGRKLLAAACLSCASAQVMKGFMKSLADDTKPATIEELVAEGGGLKLESCGGSDDAMTVEHINVRPDSLTVSVSGNMARQLTGGAVHVKVTSIDKPDGLTFAQKFKHATASSMAKGKTFSQPLCKHLGAGGDKESCIIQAGKQELRFAFPSLPQVVLAGKYTLELRAVDEAAKPVTCVRGSLNVQPGKSKGLIRTLQDCSTHLWKHGFSKAWVEGMTCETGRDPELYFETYSNFSKHLNGFWNGYCENTGEVVLHVSMSAHGLYDECDPAKSDACAHLGCSSASCQYYEGIGAHDHACLGPMDGSNNDCSSHESFSVYPSEVEAMLQANELELDSRCYHYSYDPGQPASHARHSVGPAAGTVLAVLAGAAFAFLQG